MSDITAFELLPGHLLAEQVVIGWAVTSRENAEELATILRPLHFAKPAHVAIYEAVLVLLDQSDHDGKPVPVHPTTVLEQLARAKDLGRVGGGPYLHACYSAAMPVPNAMFHARGIVDDWRRRNLHATAMTILQDTGDPAAFDPDKGFEFARHLVDQATIVDENAGTAWNIADLARETLEDIESGEITGLRTGYTDLDNVLNPAGPGELWVIGARPAVGKSTVGMDIASHVAFTLGRPVLFCSLEMRAKALMQRLLAAQARVPLTSIIQRTVTDDRHWKRLADTLSRITDSPLVIDDTPSMSLAQIRGQLRTMRRTSPADLCIVDYLGLVAEPARAENRQTAVAAISRGLQGIAREFEIPVLALAQVNRGPENRPDKAPRLSDLRESGQIEADADVVLLLHRDNTDDTNLEAAGELKVIIAKQRQGPLATVKLAFQGQYARAMDLEWSPSSAAVA